MASSVAASLTPDRLGRLGRWALAGALGIGLLLTLWLAWRMPDLLPLLPAALVGGVAAWHLFRRPLLNLCVILAGFVLIAHHEEGFQLTEVLYGLYTLGFLAHWFVTRFLLYRDAVLDAPGARALLVFLVGMTLSFGLTVLFGGNLRGALSEWIALSLIGLYFPVREACVRYENGVRSILWALLWIGLFITVRNFFTYQELLTSATQAWQVAKGRIATNDGLLMTASLFSLVLVLFVRRARVPLVGLFLIFFGSLILTQSRGYWISFLLGAFVLFLMVDRQHRLRLTLFTLAGVAGFVGIGLLFFGDYVVLIFGGILDRFSSLQSASTADISLVNRFYETRTVWALIVQNPVLGYGMSVSYDFFDLTRQTTDTDAFIHNGYLSLWYRFGLWGLILLVFFWLRSAWDGLRAFRVREAATLTRLGGIMAGITLIAFTLSAVTSSPFYQNDTTFMFGVLTGLAAGAWERARRDAAVAAALRS